MKYDAKSKSMDYSKKELEHVHGIKVKSKLKKMAGKVAEKKEGKCSRCQAGDNPNHKHNTNYYKPVKGKDF
jgi:hypothetical protein